MQREEKFENVLAHETIGNERKFLWWPWRNWQKVELNQSMLKNAKKLSVIYWTFSVAVNSGPWVDFFLDEKNLIEFEVANLQNIQTVVFNTSDDFTVMQNKNRASMIVFVVLTSNRTVVPR